MQHNIVLSTPRTYLCTADTLDFEHIRRLDSDPEIMRFISGGIPRTAQESKDWIVKRLAEYKTNGFGLMPAYLKDSDSFIGWCGLKHLENTSKIELGYRLDKPFWGMGYATEMCKGVINYAHRELGITEISAVTDIENKASQNVLIKSGFQYISRAFYYNAELDLFELKI